MKWSGTIFIKIMFHTISYMTLDIPVLAASHAQEQFILKRTLGQVDGGGKMQHIRNVEFIGILPNNTKSRGYCERLRRHTYASWRKADKQICYYQEKY